MNTPLTSTELEVGGHTYSVGRLNAKQQFHVFRRLGPIISALSVSTVDLLKAHGTLKAAEEAGHTPLQALLGPVMDQLSKMPDVDVDYVLDTCLSVCSRREGERFAPVMRSNVLVFQDMDMLVMVRLAIEVIRDNLGNFLSAPR